jgi:hypothetical protein
MARTGSRQDRGGREKRLNPRQGVAQVADKKRKISFLKKS